MHTSSNAKKLRILSGILVVLAAFVGLVMLINFIQLKSHPPVDNPAMLELIKQYEQNPKDENLQQQIRALDFISRKAFFTSHWQIKSGTLFVTIFLLLALISYHISLSFDKKQKLKPGEKTESVPVKTQNAIYLGTLVFVGIVFGIAFFTQKEMDIKNNPSNEVNYLAKNTRNSEVDTRDTEVDTRDTETDTMEAETNILEVGGDTRDTEADTMKGEDETMKVEANTLKVETKKLDTEGETKKTEANTIDSEGDTMEASSGTMNSTKSANNSSDVKPKSKQPLGSSISKSTVVPNFRGEGANSIFTVSNPPVEFNLESGENVKWRVKVAMAGYNSPIIWGEKIFITGADMSIRKLFCYDLNTGNILWEHIADNIQGSPSTPPETTEDTGLAAPTCATDGKHVFAMFGTGDIIAVDFSGKRVWERNIGVPDNHYGHSSSLICDDENLYVQYDDAKNPRLLAFENTSGKLVYEVHREWAVSWATPVLTQLQGKQQLILATEPMVVSYDPKTGKELWKCEILSGEVGPSVAVGNDIVIATNEYATMAAIKPGEGTSEVLWEFDEYLPEAASPIIINDMVIAATSYGVIAAIDIESGELIWEYETDDGYYASPLVAGNNIYIMDLGGNLHVLEAAKELKVVFETSINEPGFCTPVFVDNKMIIRGKDHLMCIE